MTPLDLGGRTTLVTGASSGIGREIAREVARRGGHLVLAARRLERLEALAEELRAAHGVEVTCVRADLADRHDRERLVAEATAGRVLHAVVLNAGVAWLGSSIQQSDAEFDELIATNILGTAHLARRLLTHQVAHGAGGLMIVSSLAGLSPTPWLAAYSGTKAFLTHYGLAIGEEVRPHGVSVTVFAPGGVLTEMGGRTGTARAFKRGDPVMMEADVCARHAVEALVRRERLRVPGWLNRVGLWLSVVAPRWLSLAVTGRIYRRALPDGADRTLTGAARSATDGSTLGSPVHAGSNA
jgi:short-subunit dehydrogenase